MAKGHARQGQPLVAQSSVKSVRMSAVDLDSSDEEDADESNKVMLGSKEDTRDLDARLDAAEESEAEELLWMKKVRAVRRSDCTQIKKHQQKMRLRFAYQPMRAATGTTSSAIGDEIRQAAQQYGSHAGFEEYTAMTKHEDPLQKRDDNGQARCVNEDSGVAVIRAKRRKSHECGLAMTTT